MKQFFLKISMVAAVLFLSQGISFAQDDNEGKAKSEKLGDKNEIIIKRKGDKDTKITVEINNGQILINGKPAEIKDGQVYIDGKPLDESGGYTISIRDGDNFMVDDVLRFVPPSSPFRGGSWSNDGNEFFVDFNRAFFGVSSEKAPGGGAQIKQVTKRSAAEKSGFRLGDIITRIDDTKIDDPEQLTETIRKHKPEDKVVITFKREGKEQKQSVVLGKLSNGPGAYNLVLPKVGPDMAMVSPDMDGQVYRNFIWDNAGPRMGIKAQDTEEGKGVKVLEVDEDSPAAKAGVKNGDIITQFDGKEVNSAGQLAELAHASKTKSSVKIKLNRDGKSQEVEVKTPKKLKTAEL